MKKCFSLLLSVLMILTVPVTALAEPESETEHRNILMTVTYEDGTIVADLVDDQGGSMSNWPVSLLIDGETVMTENTDYDGTVDFEYDIPADAQEISCQAHDGGFDIYTFSGCIESVEVDSQEDPTEPYEQDMTTTTQSDTTSTDAADSTTTAPSSSQSATTPTSSIISAPLTTTLQNHNVAIGVDVDRSLLISAQVTADDFTSKARMWMDSDLYTYHISDSSSTLHLQLTSNAQAGDINRLVAAKNLDPAFSSFEDSEVKGFAMDMTIVYVDGTNRVPIDFQDGDYTIELPVPLTMQNCEKIAVAVCTDSGLSQLKEVPISKGIMTFKVQRFQTLAVVGFGDRGAVMGSLSQTPMLVWVLIIVGVLLIIGGILLLVFVSFRRKSNGVVAVKTSASPSDDEYTLEPIENETAKDTGEPVLMDFDELMTRSEEQKTMHAPACVDQQSVEPVSMPSVSPAGQSVPAKEAQSLDDMLDDVLSDLEDMT